MKIMSIMRTTTYNRLFAFLSKNQVINSLDNKFKVKKTVVYTKFEIFPMKIGILQS